MGTRKEVPLIFVHASIQPGDPIVWTCMAGRCVCSFFSFSSWRVGRGFAMTAVAEKFAR